MHEADFGRQLILCYSNKMQQLRALMLVAHAGSTPVMADLGARSVSHEDETSITIFQTQTYLRWDIQYQFFQFVVAYIALASKDFAHIPVHPVRALKHFVAPLRAHGTWPWRQIWRSVESVSLNLPAAVVGVRHATPQVHP